MKQKSVFVLAILATLLGTPAVAEDLVLEGGTLITYLPDRDLYTPNSVVAIQNGVIRAVGRSGKLGFPRGFRKVDCKGTYIVPGLFDMHSHLGEGGYRFVSDQKLLLSRLLSYGVTTVFNTGSTLNADKELRQIAQPREAPYSRYYSAGNLICAKGGWGAMHGGETVESAAEAREKVRELKKGGADAVKLVYDDMSWLTTHKMPMLPLDVAEAVIEEAHAQKLKCYVHAPILSYAKQVMKAGADGLLHGIISDLLDDELIALMKKNKAVYVPTHSLYEACADQAAWIQRVKAFDVDKTLEPALLESFASESMQKQWQQMWDRTSYVSEHLNLLRRNTKRMQVEGILVVAGTDTGVPGVLLGISSLMEPLLLHEAGLTMGQALKAASLNAAKMLGVGEAFGSADRGRNGDLLVLEGDPLKDLKNLYKIRYVIRGGRLFTPKELRP